MNPATAKLCYVVCDIAWFPLPCVYMCLPNGSSTAFFGISLITLYPKIEVIFSESTSSRHLSKTATDQYVIRLYGCRDNPPLA